jgi:hypothetical protein
MEAKLGRPIGDGLRGHVCDHGGEPAGRPVSEYSQKILADLKERAAQRRAAQGE